MKIEELISGKDDSAEIEVKGIPVAVSALKSLMEQGYEYLRPYRNEKTFSLWGKTCTACVTFEQLAQGQ